MNEFRVECYVDGENEHNPKLLDVSDKDTEQWKKDMEARALSQYHNNKIKITDKKFWFQKAVLLKLLYGINSCRFSGRRIIKWK